MPPTQETQLRYDKSLSIDAKGGRGEGGRNGYKYRLFRSSFFLFVVLSFFLFIFFFKSLLILFYFVFFNTCFGDLLGGILFSI